jgi:hypothetical protein
MGQYLKSLNYHVSKAVQQYGTNKVGVYLVSYDEVAPILIQAQNHPVLDRINWYGSDGSAQNEADVRNVEAAKFAIKTNFLNPLAGESNERNDHINPLEDKIRKRIREFRSPYDEFAHDAFWVAALSEVTILKDLGRDSTLTAESNSIDFRTRSSLTQLIPILVLLVEQFSTYTVIGNLDTMIFGLLRTKMKGTWIFIGCALEELSSRLATRWH